jgi:hypothetical protein
MRKLIKSLLAVLVIYLFLLFSIQSMGQLRGKIYGEAQADGMTKSYKYMSTFPVVME